jgi:hypothetical protein
MFRMKTGHRQPRTVASVPLPAASYFAAIDCFAAAAIASAVIPKCL